MNKQLPTGDLRDTHLLSNIVSVSLVEGLWGITLPVVIESTFLQIFLTNSGASNAILGFVPAIYALTVAVFSLLSAFFTSHIVHKKRAVILTHIIASIPFLAYGLFLYHMPRTYVVPFFLVSYILFSLAMGLTIPVWQNFIVNIFSPFHRIAALSFMFSAQIVMRFGGSLLIMEMVRYRGLPQHDAALVFSVTGLCFFAGSFFFLFVREVIPDHEMVPREQHTARSLRIEASGIIKNRRYLTFLASTIEMFATVAAISLYARYAVDHCGIPKDIAAGLFSALIYAGALAANILFGWFNLCDLKIKFYLAKIAAVAGTVILLFSGTMTHFLVVSFFYGLARGIPQFAYNPAVKQLSGKNDATDYFALSPLILLPFSVGIPSISGLLLDVLPGPVILFCLLGVCQLCGIYFLSRTDFSSPVNLKMK